MRTLCLCLVVLVCTIASAANAAHAASAAPVIDSAHADAFLKRGDILIKFLGAGTKASATEVVIQAAQRMTQKLAGKLRKALKAGDAKAFHVALYLGNGRTAEAYGELISTARVALRSLDDHAGYRFEVYRPKDAKLALAAARVAETWARPARMHYLIPVAVPFHTASFGKHAKKAALEYGHAAAEPGGPRDVKQMFCSEFAIASYQAAVVARELTHDPQLSWQQVTMPPGIDLHAIYASPLALEAQLVDATTKKAWRHVGGVLVRPAARARR
jgi:hypothetical protein